MKRKSTQTFNLMTEVSSTIPENPKEIFYYLFLNLIKSWDFVENWGTLNYFNVITFVKMCVERKFNKPSTPHTKMNSPIEKLGAKNSKATHWLLHTDPKTKARAVDAGGNNNISSFHYLVYSLPQGIHYGHTDYPSMPRPLPHTPAITPYHFCTRNPRANENDSESISAPLETMGCNVIVFTCAERHCAYNMGAVSVTSLFACAWAHTPPQRHLWVNLPSFFSYMYYHYDFSLWLGIFRSWRFHP